MATCNVTALEQAACLSGFTCLSPGSRRAQTIKLQLLCEILSNGGGSVGYSTYQALLSQSGTNEPAVTVLQNTIGNILWSRVNVGEYSGTLAGVFVEGKTALIINASSGSGGILRAISRPTENLIFIHTTIGGSLSDDLLAETFVQILVYP